LVNGAVQALLALAASAALFALRPTVALLCLAILPILSLHFLIFRQSLRSASGERLESWARMGGAMQEHFRSMESIRVFRVEHREVGRVLGFLRGAAAASWKQFRIDTNASVTSQLLASAWPLLLLIVVSGFMTSGTMTLGQCSGVVFYAGILVANVRGIAGQVLACQAGMAALNRLHALASLPSDSACSAPSSNSAVPPNATRARIEVSGLHFRYDDGPWVIAGLNLTLAAGRIYGLTGRSGSGKTTLARLLLRLEEPTQGEIRFEGQCLSTLPRRQLPSAVTLVPQDLLLVRRSVGENIAWGRDGASPAEITRAAARAGADEFIRKLPAGYDTRLGDDGTWLSRGQRQRIALARALLLDSAVLILDEASASLDPEAEDWFCNAVRGAAARGTTCLVISHSPRVLSIAERCFELDAGRLVEWSPSPSAEANELSVAVGRLDGRSRSPDRAAQVGPSHA
jgi:ABC-type bacteriocin/lantibiotic exporter with double-glycine peptidase domain